MEVNPASDAPSAKLLDSSVAAALSAIEIYNKPDFKYREEIFSILIINAWELLLKAKIVADSKERLESIYVFREDGRLKMNRANTPLTLDLNSALKAVRVSDVITENLLALVSIRDSAVHLYATESLNYLVYTLGAAALQNYQKFVFQSFGRSLLEYNFYILPLAFAYNFKTLKAIDIDLEPEMIGSLLKSVSSAQDKVGSDEFHFVCEITTELRSAKKFVSAEPDLSVTVDSAADAKVVYRTQPLTDRYPLSYAEMLARIKAALPAVKQSAIDAAIRSLDVKGNVAYSAYNWRSKRHEQKAKMSGLIPKGTTSIYNEDAVKMLTEHLRT